MTKRKPPMKTPKHKGLCLHCGKPFVGTIRKVYCCNQCKAIIDAQDAVIKAQRIALDNSAKSLRAEGKEVRKAEKKLLEVRGQ